MKCIRETVTKKSDVASVTIGGVEPGWLNVTEGDVAFFKYWKGITKNRDIGCVTEGWEGGMSAASVTIVTEATTSLFLVTVSLKLCNIENN